MWKKQIMFQSPNLCPAQAPAAPAPACGLCHLPSPCHGPCSFVWPTTALVVHCKEDAGDVGLFIIINDY